MELELDLSVFKSVIQKKKISTEDEKLPVIQEALAHRLGS